MSRSYLDWNATAPLCAEARAAMVAAMEVTGNPSSVHREGRAARALVERARAQVARALGAEGADIVFTSGATESAALALAGRGLLCSAIEHEAVLAWCAPDLPADAQGAVRPPDPARAALQLANSETGVIQDLPAGLAVSDLTQGFGKIGFCFDASGIDMGLVSAHKLGGPKGVGALVLRRGLDLTAQLRGGGQEMGRRSGTENVIGIAGFGAAAEAAATRLARGDWAEVEEFRNILESVLDAAGKDIIFVGKGARRLPNTCCIAVPGWRGDTQVMAMDLAGFAISAGSACSSGKARPSAVPQAMGHDRGVAESVIRVSLGPGVRRDEVLRFADVWLAALHRHRERGAIRDGAP